MYILKVGELYIPGRTSWPETPEYNWYDSGHEMRLFFKSPTPHEIEQIRAGDAQFGLFLAEGVLFVLAKFGDLNWMDMPFHLSQVPSDRRPDVEQPLGPETRALIQVLLIDADTGILKVLRAVTLSPEFTRTLHGQIGIQDGNMTRPEYEAAVNRAYSQFSMTELMQARALIKSRGGE